MEYSKLFDVVKDRWGSREEINALGDYLGGPEWILMPAVSKITYKVIKDAGITKCLERSGANKKNIRKETFSLIKTIRGARESSSLKYFRCGKNCFGVCYPLIMDKNIFGFVLVCGLEKKMTKYLGKIFTTITDAFVRDCRKGFDLEEANESIRPRAVALSTVHTLHRLMTSALDLNELLPRIARLSLQVIRANRCSIKLVDKKRKALIPKTTIDLRKEKTKLKKVQIGKYAPGRAVKKGGPVRSKNYLAVPMVDEDVVGVITLYDKFEDKEFTLSDQEIMKTLAEQAAVAIKNAQLYKEQADITSSSIKCIARLLQNRPHGTKRAEASFGKLISIIGPKFKMNEREIRTLQYAAMLHDAGQIGIPERVLMKKGELTGREYDIIKKHPMTGAEILSKFKPLKPIVPIILYHHERFDGKGYPKGLKGKDIPLAARMLAVISVFEVLITEKPYRKAHPLNNAIREIRNSAGKQFDPAIVEALCDAIKRKDVRKLLDKELGVK